MATLKEYAALAAYIYNDQRGGGGESSTNRLQLPPGWKSLTELGFTAGDNLNWNPYSFTGGAFINQNTGEIVVAYKGTDVLTEFDGRSWNTVADLITDVGLAITGKTLGLYNLQQLAASSFYLAVKDWAIQNGYNADAISFTGHSLGGGLASNIAVWFDRPATTFAEAPFEQSAINPVAVTAAAATLTLQAGVTASATVLAEILKLSGLVAPGEYDRRQAAVTNYFVDGEFLMYGRAVLPTVVGTDVGLAVGSPSISLALGLHSMNLHAAMLFDDRLRDLATKIPELLPTLLDTNLYAADPNYAKRDLITSLVNDQLRQGFDADSSLKRFTTDIDKLKATVGVSASPAIRTALIASAMDFHFNVAAGNTGTFFTSAAGALHFDFKSIGVSDLTTLKALPLLREAASSTSIGADPFNLGYLRQATAWHVQTGAGSMIWTDTAVGVVNDAAIGGAQDDVLRAGAGNDYLVGGAGIDILDGGTGNDLLAGGAGADAYQFSGDFGNDTITDSDGLGNISIDGNVVSGGDKVSDNVWVSADGLLVYTLTDVGLVIGRRPSAGASVVNGSIRIANWLPGQLGINLSGNPANLSAGLANHLGDERPKIIGVETQLNITPSDPKFNTYAWNEVSWAANGVLVNGVAEADFADVIYGGAGNDAFTANGGNDAIDGGAGDDVISGGAGDDLLAGGTGSDVIDGGAGNDFISSGGSLVVPLRKGPTESWRLAA